MQNKAVVYGVVAVAVVILGAGAWMVVSKGGMPGSAASSTAQTQTQNTSLKNLYAMGGTNKCTFTSSTQNSQSQGVIYINNGEMRGDFTSVAEGKTVESHMIVKDNTSYLWSDAVPQGIKMSFDAMATQNDANPQSSVNPDATVEYACSAWVADPSMFTLPTNVTFQDMSSLTPGAGASTSGSTGVSGNTAQCAACNQITDPTAKAQCKAALQCK